MTNQNVLTFEDLKELTGYERPADVENCLSKRGIHTFPSRKGCWTTLALVNAAGGIVSEQHQGDGDIL